MFGEIVAAVNNFYTHVLSYLNLELVIKIEILLVEFLDDKFYIL